MPCSLATAKPRSITPGRHSRTQADAPCVSDLLVRTATILAVMDPDAAGSGTLDRLGDLLAGLGAALGTGDLLGWAGPGDIDAVPDEVFRVVTNAGLMADGDPRRRRPVIIPADGAALMERMWEVDEPAAIALLTTLAAGTQPSRPRRHHLRRRDEDEPQDKRHHRDTDRVRGR